jgi:hypothetical protein
MTSDLPSMPGIVPNDSPGTHKRTAGTTVIYTKATTLGIANTWTIMFHWSVVNVSNHYQLLSIGTTADDLNRINVGHRGDVANDPMRIVLYDSAGVLFKQYDYNSAAYTHINVGRFHHAVITWDGTTLKYYNDGLLFTASTLTTDDAGTQTDTARVVAVGSTTAGTAIVHGQHHTYAMWNSVLTANEVASIYQAGNNSRVNLLATFQDYVSSANLVHWWHLGELFGLEDLIMSWPDRAGSLVLGGKGSGSTQTTTLGIVDPANTQGLYPNRNYISMDIGRALAGNAAVIGVANAWTLSGITRRVSTTGATWVIANIAPTATNVNEILVQVLGATANEPWQIKLWDSAGVAFKQYEFDLIDCAADGSLSDAWIQWFITWDGTNLYLYRNGVRMSPLTKTTDNSGTQTNTSRQVSFSIPKSLTGVTYRCFTSEYVMWDIALSGTEIERLWDGGHNSVDLAEDTLGYYSSSHLKHWWRMGHVPRSIGTGSSGIVVDEVASGGIDINALAFGTPTRINIITGGQSGDGACLYCNAATYKRSLSAPAGNLLGIANNWVISFWHYAETAPGVGVEQTYLDIGAGSANGIRIFSTQAKLEVQLWDQNGSLFQHFTATNAVTAAGLWRWHQVAWDGSTLTIHKDAATTATTLATVVDNAGTMVDTPRAISIGCSIGGANPIFDTWLSTFQMWNTTTGFVSSTSKLAVYLARNSKDLRKNFGLYAVSANLVHWWRLGASPSQPGMDYANPTTGAIPLTANYDERAIALWGPA